MGRSNKKKERKSITKKREMYNRMGIECESQCNDDLYLELKDNGKYTDFLALIKYCSSEQLTIEQTCEKLNISFSFYIKDKPITVDRFKNMLQWYREVADAWAYGTGGTNIEKMKIKEKATDIILNMEIGLLESEKRLADVSDKRMKAIELFNRMYNKDYQDFLNAKVNNNGANGGINVSIDFGGEVGEGYE
jgi:hypothetical protein